MIISPKVVDAMNEQIRNEFTASSQYVAIAVYFDEESLPDLAQFFYAQAEEERFHAMKFVKFLLDTGAKPVIPDQPALRNAFESAADAVNYALEQEVMVTNQINNIVSLAIAENDHASNQFLQWFVDEQVEEVDSMTTLLNTIKHAGPNLLLVEDFVRRTMAAGAGGE
jgi:ferritin